MSRTGILARIGENVRLAFATVASHKMRSALVILGVGIGVTTLMGMVTILVGFGNKISADMRSSDNSVIYLTRLDLFVGGDVSRFAHRPEIDVGDLRAIREEVRSVRLADFQQQPQWSTILHHEGEKTGLVTVIGASEQFPLIFTIPLTHGRNFSNHEVESSARVVMLGWGAYEDLFPSLDPVGKRIRIRGEAYTVVGVYGARKHLFGRLADNYAVVPYTTFRKEWGQRSDQTFIAAVPRDPGALDAAMDDITAVMRSRHGLRPGEEDDFAVTSNDAAEELVGQVTGQIGLVLTVLASIGLMVGGIGVMAIMLVSVTERTREIGIRKSIGASRSDILYQFLIEAATLTGLGGVAGVVTGIVVAQVLGALIGLPADTPVGWTTVAVVFSAGIGIVFGLYPAMRASRLDPVEAMRTE